MWTALRRVLDRYGGISTDLTIGQLDRKWSKVLYLGHCNVSVR